MKRLMLAGALLLDISGLTQAADMPLKALPAPPAAFTWTGIYGGGYIGGMRSKTDNDFVSPPPASWQQSANVGIAGGIVGIQYQWGNLVLGVEGNAGGALSNGLGAASCNPAASCIAGTTITATSPSAIFSAGGRAGWAFGYWLPYVSGGYANAATFAQTIQSPATTWPDIARWRVYRRGPRLCGLRQRTGRWPRISPLRFSDAAGRTIQPGRRRRFDRYI
jgi:hypothetical protein